MEVYLSFEPVEKMGRTVEKKEGDWGNCGECLGMFPRKNKNCKFFSERTGKKIFSVHFDRVL